MLASKGVMVAYRGQVRFTHEGAGSIGRLLQKVLTAENTPLMRVSGQGEVFLARLSEHVFTILLEATASAWTAATCWRSTTPSPGTSAACREPGCSAAAYSSSS